MTTSITNAVPDPQESLADYVRRVRTALGLSQKELAERAGIHLQSVGKIERGQTTRLKQQPKSGLALALNIPVDYLDAVCKGVAVEVGATLKFCPNCWKPGTIPDAMWTNMRAQYCYLCGSFLRDRCTACEQPIESLRFRFCPHCGKPYKNAEPRVLEIPCN